MNGGSLRLAGPQGLTLVEVLVALVILEVGILGGMGILVLAGRAMTRAERLERAVTVAEGIADSLSVARRLVDGARILPGGDTLRWATDSMDGSFSVTYVSHAPGGPALALRGLRSSR